MKHIIYLLIGTFLGVIFMKSEITSWYRIYEMFRFESFHMYGIIGTSVVLGIIQLQIVKRKSIKTFFKKDILLPPKKISWKRYLFGGIAFGLGWALAGACPGPIFSLIGAGFFPVLIVFLFTGIGTFIYGVLKNKLPH